MASGKAEAALPPAWYESALKAPSVSEKNLAATLLMMAEGSNEKGKTALWAASTELEDSGSTFYPFFMSSVIAGLVPPPPLSSPPSLATTSCMLFIFIPTPSSSCRSSPSIARHTWG